MRRIGLMVICVLVLCMFTPSAFGQRERHGDRLSDKQDRKELAELKKRKEGERKRRETEERLYREATDKIDKVYKKWKKASAKSKKDVKKWNKELKKAMVSAGPKVQKCMQDIVLAGAICSVERAVTLGTSSKECKRAIAMSSISCMQAIDAMANVKKNRDKVLEARFDGFRASKEIGIAEKAREHCEKELRELVERHERKSLKK